MATKFVPPCICGLATWWWWYPPIKKGSLFLHLLNLGWTCNLPWSTVCSGSDLSLSLFLRQPGLPTSQMRGHVGDNNGAPGNNQPTARHVIKPAGKSQSREDTTTDLKTAADHRYMSECSREHRRITQLSPNQITDPHCCELNEELRLDENYWNF